MYMLHNVDATLDEHRETWEVEERMQHLSGELKLRIHKLEDLLAEKQELSIPYAKIKREIREEYADKILQLAGFLHEIGVTNGDKQLVLYSHITRTDLVFNTIQDCLIKSQHILELANKHKAELQIFSHGEDVYNDALEQLNSFQSNGLLPFDRRNRRRDANREIRKQISETRSFLSHRLDRVMLFFARRHPSFYKNYLLSRVIPKISATRSRQDSEMEDSKPDGIGKSVFSIFKAS